VFSAERAATIQRIQFSQPLDGQVSDLKGTGDLASALSNAVRTNPNKTMNSVNNTSEEFGVYLTSNKETLNMCK
jgi:hypothetical protein